MRAFLRLVILFLSQLLGGVTSGAAALVRFARALRAEWHGQLPHGGVPQIVSRPGHPSRDMYAIQRFQTRASAGLLLA